MNRIRIAISLLIFGLMAGGIFAWPDGRHANAAPEIPKEPLYMFRNPQKRWIYKRGNTLKVSEGPWVNEGSVCYVVRDPAPGLKPVFMLIKSHEVGNLYSYTTNPDTPDYFGGAGALINAGAEFYVAATQLPGTVPLYSFHHAPQYNGPGTPLNPGTGTFLLSTDAHAPSSLWKRHGKLGYVWTGSTHDDDQLPDLTIVKTTVRENGIQAIIRNEGKKHVSSKPGVTAVLTVIDRTGKPVHFSGAKQLGGMSPGQQHPFLFETGKLALARNRYRVQVDAANLVEESNEKNNDTDYVEIPGPKLKINPLPPGFVQPPSISLTDVKGLGNGRMAYNFAVTNWDKFKPESFHSLENTLPPSPCGGGNTNARLIARIIVIHNSGPMPVACKPLNSPQDLRSIILNTPDRLGDSDKVRIYVEDRATAAKYESSPFPVGVYGVDKILVPMGCKFFLGRASSYMCTSDQGFAACENLRQKGKPIECRRTGKAQH